MVSSPEGSPTEPIIETREALNCIVQISFESNLEQSFEEVQEIQEAQDIHKEEADPAKMNFET